MTIVEIIQFLIAVRRVLDILIEDRIKKAAKEDAEKLAAIRDAERLLSAARTAEEKAVALKKLSDSVNGAGYLPPA